jgi:hypothetical protein
VISVAEYYMGRDKKYLDLLTQTLRENAEETVSKANQLLQRFGEARKVTSGWRPPSVNAVTPRAAKRSLHMTCEAIDLEDEDGQLDDWCLDHPEVLQEIGLWQEHPASTKDWCHLQIVPPRSGRRVFYP